MNFEQRAKFRHALIKLIDNHQEEFEQLCGQSVFQVNNVAKDKAVLPSIQVLFSEHDAMEVSFRSITEQEIVVR